MLDTTLQIIRSGLKADPSLTPNDRARILVLLREAPRPPKDENGYPEKPRIIGRAEAAERLDKSLRLIDRLAQQGILRKVKLPGRKRAMGFLESDIEVLIGGSV